MSFDAPVIDWLALLPVLILLGAAVVGVLVEAFVIGSMRRPIQVVLAGVAAVAATTAAVLQWALLDGVGVVIAQNLFVADRHSYAWQVIIGLFTILGLALFASRTAGEDAFTPLGSAAPGSVEEGVARTRGLAQTEVFPLALFAAGGMMLFTQTTQLIALFVVLEVFSLPLYILVALARRRRLLSQEAALKYFLMGAFSSAIYLFGASLLFAAAGAFHYSGISLAADAYFDRDPVFIAALLLVVIGLLFKLGAAPFHAWTPDAYQGAPTAVTGFMAAATKAAAAAALLRLLYIVGFDFSWEISPALWTVAIITMAVGTVVALVQTDIKRMLAYSSVAHAGFILVALTAFNAEAIAATPFYLLTYGVATIGAFAVVSQVRESAGGSAAGAEASRLGQWAGLGKRDPWLAGAMALFLLSFAGIPLTAGFVGKFVAFAAAMEAGAWPLVTVAVVASAAAAFFYVRLIVLMFLTPVPEDLEDEVVVGDSIAVRSVVAVAAIFTIVVGVAPGGLLALAENAAVLLP